MDLCDGLLSFKKWVKDILTHFSSSDSKGKEIVLKDLCRDEIMYAIDMSRDLGLYTETFGDPPHAQISIFKKKRIHRITFNLDYSDKMVETSNKALAKYQLAINNDRFSSPTAVEESVELKLGPPQVVHEAKSTELGKPKDLTDICIEKESLLKLIESNQVAIITSEANSVVIPQIIMDDCAVKKTPCKILCVKQNRLAAIAAAQQAAEERGEKLGNSVGYQVKFRCVYAQQTVLIYCTNGIVLRSLGNDKDNFLCNVTHLIVDDVQARNKYTDLLLLFLKHNLLAFAHLKVILISTSTDVGMFVSYFDEAPVLHVPNRSYEVQKLFFDDILTILLEVGLGMENPHVYVEKCFLNNEVINYDLIVKIIIYIHTRNKCGAILVFLPGYEEMVRCETMIESSTLNQGELQIYKVHGNMENITSSMHEKFKSQRKIILASSIAESSLLIPDVVYVIDTGKVRKEYYNYVSKWFSNLNTLFTSYVIYR